MARNNVLRWLDGRGWLVLSGSPSDEIRALALGRAAADGGVAYVTFGQSIEAEKTLADMEDLGAPSGYLVDVLTEDDATIHTRLGDASLIVITGGDSVDEMRSALLGAAASGIQEAFANGALILAEGLSAMLTGAWVISDSGALTPGLEWVDGALIIPALTSVVGSQQAQEVLAAQPMGIAVSIGAGSALALGPDGEVETWGQKQVTVTLGRNYSA